MVSRKKVQPKGKENIFVALGLRSTERRIAVDKHSKDIARVKTLFQTLGLIYAIGGGYMNQNPEDFDFETDDNSSSKPEDEAPKGESK